MEQVTMEQLTIDEWAKAALRHSQAGFYDSARPKIYAREGDSPGDSGALSFLCEEPLHPESDLQMRALRNSCDLLGIGAGKPDSQPSRPQIGWMVTPTRPAARPKTSAWRIAIWRMAPANLFPLIPYEMDTTHPAVVAPEEPVHQVLNLPEFGARATSIHIYSYPYASCEVYSVERGSYADVPLHYSSEYGKLSPDEKLM